MSGSIQTFTESSVSWIKIKNTKTEDIFMAYLAPSPLWAWTCCTSCSYIPGIQNSAILFSINMKSNKKEHDIKMSPGKAGGRGCSVLQNITLSTASNAHIFLWLNTHLLSSRPPSITSINVRNEGSVSEPREPIPERTHLGKLLSAHGLVLSVEPRS